MAKNSMTEAQRFDWLLKVIKREQGAGTQGSILVTLEAGTITRVKVERVETPAFTNPSTQ